MRSVHACVGLAARNAMQCMHAAFSGLDGAQVTQGCVIILREAHLCVALNVFLIVTPHKIA